MTGLCAACSKGPRQFNQIFVRGHSLNDPGHWAPIDRATCEVGSLTVADVLRRRDEANLESQLNSYYGAR